MRSARATDTCNSAFETPGIVGMKRDGRVLRVLCSAGADGLVAEARTFGPVSIDVTPVALKDIFLETIAVEN